MFKDRADAGMQLAEKLVTFQDDPAALVLALPRGGVVVGAAIAEQLRLPLDIIVTRKIGAPGNPEYAVAAITESGDMILNEREAVDPVWLEAQREYARAEALRRIALYRGTRAPLQLRNKRVLVVDDGLATGLTMRAAIASIKKQHPEKIIVVLPVAAKQSLTHIAKDVDEIVALESRDDFQYVAAFYKNFSETTDNEVIKLLQKI